VFAAVLTVARAGALCLIIAASALVQRLVLAAVSRRVIRRRVLESRHARSFVRGRVFHH